MRPNDRTFRNGLITTSSSVPACAPGRGASHVAGRMLVERPPLRVLTIQEASHFPNSLPALILGNTRAQAFGEFAVVQAFEQSAVACPRFLTAPEYADAQVAQNS